MVFICLRIRHDNRDVLNWSGLRWDTLAEWVNSRIEIFCRAYNTRAMYSSLFHMFLECAKINKSCSRYWYLSLRLFFYTYIFAFCCNYETVSFIFTVRIKLQEVCLLYIRVLHCYIPEASKVIRNFIILNNSFWYIGIEYRGIPARDCSVCLIYLLMEFLWIRHVQLYLIKPLGRSFPYAEIQ